MRLAEDPIIESAKAAGEIAKAAGKAIDATRDAGGFVARHIEGPLEQVAGLIEDRLKFVRWERRARLMQRAAELLEQTAKDGGIRPVPLSFAIPLLEAGSLEQNDNLQDLWAALLANAADAHVDVEPRHAFITILKDLTALDARNLNVIYSAAAPGVRKYGDNEALWTTYLPERVLDEHPDVSDPRPSPECETSIGNLERLGLIDSVIAWGGVGMSACIARTSLGRAFYRACHRVSAPMSESSIRETNVLP